MTGESVSLDIGMGSARYELFAAENEDSIRSGVRELLTTKLQEAITAGDHATVHKVSKALHSRRRFNRLCHFVERNALPEFLEARKTGAIGADGEFFKWLMVWLFEEGNWKKILEMIMLLFGL